MRKVNKNQRKKAKKKAKKKANKSKKRKKNKKRKEDLSQNQIKLFPKENVLIKILQVNLRVEPIIRS